jgi:VIT1/CCC1 family predicted Fe2+/Mn2+ transporter
MFAVAADKTLTQSLANHLKVEEDGSNPFTHLAAPFLAGFSVPTIGQLAASKPAPWRDLALALFVVAAGLLLAGFQLSIGSLSSDDLSLWIRGPLTVAGVAALTAGLIVLVKNARGVNQWS